MLIEKFVVIFVAILVLIYLSKRFIKRYEPINLIIIPLLALSLGMYIPFAIHHIYIPIIVQILIIVFGFIVPIFAMFLQYNNIILTRKLLYYRMKLTYISKNYTKTIQLIGKLVDMEGRKAEYLHLLGMCYKHLGDDINARDSFALAVELDKNDYKSYFELGLVLDETNKKEVAIVMFDKALKIKPDFYEAEEALGICLTSQGKFEEAANIYKKALKYHADSYELYYNIAIIEMELGNYDAAEEAFEKAGEIKPDLYSAFYNLGSLEYLKGDYDKAINAYKKVLQSGTYGPKGYYKLAIVYAAQKEYEKAMSSLEYAIELDPKYIEKAQEELIFKAMQDKLDGYLQDRQTSEKLNKEKHNYMQERLNIFRKKEKVEHDCQQMEDESN